MMFGDRLDQLRHVPLPAVMRETGAQRDHYDKAKWHTPKGDISITGMKFMNWHQSRGGGGAIDLAMHLNDLDFQSAVAWLQHHFSIPPDSAPPPALRRLTLPPPDRSLIVRGLVAVLATLRKNIAAFDQRIAELVASHPDGTLFASLPGAGAVLVPRMIVAFGTRRARYQNAYEVQCYSGIAPVTEASGNSEWVHFRFACPKFLRQTFHEFAGHSIGQSEWAKAYYEHLRNDKNKSHHAAVRSLAFKWIRIIFRCWKDGKPYEA